MFNEFRLLKTTRDNADNIINSFDINEINLIPENFNNNLFWNYAHSIVTQQLLCYKLSGLNPAIPEELIELFKKGSIPSNAYDKEKVDLFKGFNKSLVDKFESDYEQGLFNKIEFKPYMTSYGFELSNIEDAIKFNNTHEGVHLGYMMALKKSLK